MPIDMKYLLFLGLLILTRSVNGQPQWPSSFSATITTTAHMVPEDISYPPREKVVKLMCDRGKGKALFVVEKGLDEGKTFYRDFGGENEYLVKGGEGGTCKRSWLGGGMPEVVLPKMIEIGEEVVGGRDCVHWVRDEGVERVHMWWDKDRGGGPVRLTHEHVGEDGVSEATMSYDVSAWTEGVGDFGLEGVEGGWTHEKCERFVGGFPYVHLWHSYLRV